MMVRDVYPKWRTYAQLNNKRYGKELGILQNVENLHLDFRSIEKQSNGTCYADLESFVLVLILIPMQYKTSIDTKWNECIKYFFSSYIIEM